MEQTSACFAGQAERRTCEQIGIYGFCQNHFGYNLRYKRRLECLLNIV